MAEAVEAESQEAEETFETVVVVERESNATKPADHFDEPPEEILDNAENDNSGSENDATNKAASCLPGSHNVNNSYPKSDEKSPAFFTVEFRTTVDLGTDDPTSIVMEVNRTWAPLGVDRFYSLLQDHYFDCAAFFRVVPHFVVQFGIAAEPEESEKWGGDSTIPDDPVLESNLQGTVSFATAGPNTRTTQIFVNLADNARLDGMGFAPFAKVTTESLAVLRALYNPTPGDSGGADQGSYEDGGNEWILSEYPNIDIILGSPMIKIF